MMRKGLWILVGVVIGALAGERAYAQLMRLTDGTVATKTVLYGLSGTEVTSFGGGTQYTEADTDASITGTAVMLEGAANALGAWIGGAGVNSAAVGRVTIATDDEINDDLDAIAFSAAALDNALFVDDADFTDGTSSHFLNGCVAESAAPSTVTEGDVGACAMTLNRAVKMTLYNSSGTELTSTEVVEDAPETAGVTGPMTLNVRRDVAAASAGASGDNATFNTDALGLLWTRFLDPCSGVAKTAIPVDIVTATTTELTAALAGASTNYYVCSINLVTAAANNVALVDDDTDNCASVTSGVAGGFGSAAEGWNLAANGGLTIGSGLGTIAKTNGTNRVLCLITSAATQLSGSITVVAAP